MTNTTDRSANPDTLDAILAELQKLNATLDHYRPIVDRLLRKEN